MLKANGGLTRRQSLQLLAGTAGLALPITLVAGENPQREDWWRAWAVSQGSKTKLVVEGIVDGGPGTVAVLEEAVPPGVNQKILLLRLKKLHLPGTWTANVIPIPARLELSPYTAGKYDQVQIHCPDNHVASIKKIFDAGSGPT